MWHTSLTASLRLSSQFVRCMLVTAERASPVLRSSRVKRVKASTCCLSVSDCLWMVSVEDCNSEMASCNSLPWSGRMRTKSADAATVLTLPASSRAVYLDAAAVQHRDCDLAWYGPFDLLFELVS
jgi:hypothetical protein